MQTLFTSTTGREIANWNPNLVEQHTPGVAKIKETNNTKCYRGFGSTWMHTACWGNAGMGKTTWESQHFLKNLNTHTTCDPIIPHAGIYPTGTPSQRLRYECSRQLWSWWSKPGTKEPLAGEWRGTESSAYSMEWTERNELLRYSEGASSALFGVKGSRLKEEPSLWSHVDSVSIKCMLIYGKSGWLCGKGSGRKNYKGAQVFGVMEHFVFSHDGFLCIDNCQNSSRFTLPTDVAHHMKIVLQLVDREVKSRCWVRDMAWASEPACPTGSQWLQTAGSQTVLSRGRLSNPSLHLCRLQETNWLSLLLRKESYFSRNSLHPHAIKYWCV